MKRINKPDSNRSTYSNHSNVSLTVYDGFQYREVIGSVTKVDQQLKRIRIDCGDEWEWVYHNCCCVEQEMAKK